MTETDIVNGGLAAIGEPPIYDLLTDNQPVAAICRAVYAQCRDALLRKYVWNFATTRGVWLAATPPARPTFGEGVLVPVAADCLRILEVNGYQASSRSANFSQEGRNLVMQATRAEVRYIQRVVNPDDWDSTFVRAMHYALAADMAMKLTQARSRLEEMRAVLADILRDATAVDTFENASWVIPADYDDNQEGGFGRGW